MTAYQELTPFVVDRDWSAIPHENGTFAIGPGAASAHLPLSTQARLIEAARSAQPVEGLTHTHYRYPARFSPTMVRELIETFTVPGDLVYDPYVGGGTTMVEALARCRRGVATDISSLATFITRAKTLLPNEADICALESWVATTAAQISMHGNEPAFPAWEEAGYFRHMNHRSRWRLRKAIAQAVAAADEIGCLHLETLARCVILKTAQWALDGRKKLPNLAAFRSMLAANGLAIANGTRKLVASAGARPHDVTIINRSVIGAERDEAIIAAGTPRLILTSPPYPGVHVLYHRWQVDGRKESAAPFFIANALDGSGESFYTMGGRKSPALTSYFAQLRDAMTSIVALSNERTIFVQTVAFSQPEWQLARYLDVCREAGMTEFTLPILREQDDGRLWRDVPNRRWHAGQKGKTNAAREVVLFHTLSGCR